MCISMELKSRQTPTNTLGYGRRAVSGAETMYFSKCVMMNSFAVLKSESRYIAAITASTLSAKIAGLSFPPVANSDLPKYKKSLKL